eukprot:SAG11_NODE_1010_length_6199_cov_2.572131_9_plen_166_part_00
MQPTRTRRPQRLVLTTRSRSMYILKDFIGWLFAKLVSCHSTKRSIAPHAYSNWCVHTQSLRHVAAALTVIPAVSHLATAHACSYLLALPGGYKGPRQYPAGIKDHGSRKLDFFFYLSTKFTKLHDRNAAINHHTRPSSHSCSYRPSRRRKGQSAQESCGDLRWSF